MPPPLLLNENFPAPSVRLLRAAGLDARSVAEVLPSANDAAVLALAVAQSRWLVTFDRDYGELIFRRKQSAPPAVILLRVPHYRACERLGLIGKADVVEFLPDGTTYPIEYKHGGVVKAKHGHDALQLAT